MAVGPEGAGAVGLRGFWVMVSVALGFKGWVKLNIV